MKLYESAENYLETILVLKQERGLVRSIDVAQRLGFSKPSVSRAVSLLKEGGYLTMAPGEGWLELTEKGQRVAEEIYERHRCLSAWLAALGVPEEIAAADACKIEHDLSPETFAKLKEHIQRSYPSLEWGGAAPAAQPE